MAKKSVNIGKQGQNAAKLELTRLGVQMVQQIATPIRVIASRMIDNVPYSRYVYGDRVVGDLIGHRTDGIMVLAEVKSTSGDNLTWSTMKKHGTHQAENLNRHALHAIALVVWVRYIEEIYVLEWPIPGFGPGKSITPQRAKELAVKDIDATRWHLNFVRCNCPECDPMGELPDDGSPKPWHEIYDKKEQMSFKFSPRDDTD